ncbi:phosphoribosylaminoimidazole-succinocarboxamide synthase [Halolactibacillus halophilus]|uniref:Phosphoribosylaminoimidazole-succinocarboxamide synthase n=1 Tax=Halolactibacillus halophilus TaxID=306540 RepID=A0A1I5QSA0_9BACI|nr:phosphoribosylaminoimidazolesuccinocarboxamide synthase [Halolactibacillus halophilus]GEM01898.1 phosphoribosylaminoimidazole-succinocarboxamide synthase [Halolactibacillus halophilus]SFP49112.1 phosphoribosylaminoimidazole-succinocarboxamide synthase [Halolactibacillus halophilus]
MLELLYEGKAKKVYQTDKEDELILSYKDDATAFNGKKKAQFTGKGRFNNLITAHVFRYLTTEAIPHHFIETLNDTDQRVYKTSIIPIEVVVRNRSSYSLNNRLGIKEDAVFEPALVEWFYKNDALNDPLINDQHVFLLTDVSKEELNQIYELTLKINNALKRFFHQINLDLIDFKIEFGRNSAGEIILSDEISPDTCRLEDSYTKQHLDKDVFRQGTGNLLDVYQIILSRLEELS